MLAAVLLATAAALRTEIAAEAVIRLEEPEATSPNTGWWRVCDCCGYHLAVYDQLVVKRCTDLTGVFDKRHLLKGDNETESKFVDIKCNKCKKMVCKYSFPSEDEETWRALPGRRGHPCTDDLTQFRKKMVDLGVYPEHNPASPSKTQQVTQPKWYIIREAPQDDAAESKSSEESKETDAETSLVQEAAGSPDAERWRAALESGDPGKVRAAVEELQDAELDDADVQQLTPAVAAVVRGAVEQSGGLVAPRPGWEDAQLLGGAVRLLGVLRARDHWEAAFQMLLLKGKEYKSVRTKAARALGTQRLNAPEAADQQLFALLRRDSAGAPKYPVEVRTAAYLALDQVAQGKTESKRQQAIVDVTMPLLEAEGVTTESADSEEEEGESTRAGAAEAKERAAAVVVNKQRWLKDELERKQAENSRLREEATQKDAALGNLKQQVQKYETWYERAVGLFRRKSSPPRDRPSE